MTDLKHIESWVFDLDNTLYGAECMLFEEIDARMTAFIRKRLATPISDARRLQKHYYVKYGTTLSGLMREHDVCPDEFLDYVHDIDMSPISENKALAAAIRNLPGKKLIFTNGSVAHAERVTAALGLNDLFNDIFDIKAADYTPKPHPESYKAFLKRHEVNPSRAIMFDDLSHNLEEPHALGMTTVLVCSDAAWLEDEPEKKRPAKIGDAGDHIHYATNDIAEFLTVAVTSS